MRRLRPWLFPLLALLVAGAFAVLRSDTARHSKLPLADNRGPHGSAVLATYLREGGHAVQAVHEGLPGPEAGLWILAAPTARELSREDVATLRAFVERGGTLVYLSPSPEKQPHVTEWLGLSEGPTMGRETRGVIGDDPGGLTLSLVSRGEGGLRFASGRALIAESAVPIAAKGDAVGLWRRALGKGAVWIAAGPSLLENARLGLGHNLSFWEALAAQGPVTWIESFHVASAPPSSRGLWVFGLQLILCVLVGAWCFGPRLGPPRPLPDEQHRSSLESVRALGWLLRRSRVEPELAGVLLQRLQRGASALLGKQAPQTAQELAAALQVRTGLPADQTFELLEALESASRARRLGPQAYARLAMRAALLERAMQGVASPAATRPVPSDAVAG